MKIIINESCWSMYLLYYAKHRFLEWFPSTYKNLHYKRAFHIKNKTPATNTLRFTKCLDCIKRLCGATDGLLCFVSVHPAVFSQGQHCLKRCLSEGVPVTPWLMSVCQSINTKSACLLFIFISIFFTFSEELRLSLTF